MIPADEQVAKLRAAAAARDGDDLVIIGRTDARQPLGLEEAIRRGKLYREAGADVVFIEAPRSVDELRELGYKLVVYPLSALFSAAKAIEDTYRTLFETKTTAARRDAMVSFERFEEMIGVPGWQELERQYVAE